MPGRRLAKMLAEDLVLERLELSSSASTIGRY